jgi:rhodanese-related sulfurtransferase/glyoxylase-like metal-dependent hydrolase (beta-lactamase superfamily II)
VFIIDPRRDVDEYVSLIEREQLQLKGVMITHLHADFVAGHEELAKRYKAPLYIGRHAGAEYPHTPIADGMELMVGHARLVFWETPGHTPGDVSTLVFDSEKDPREPLAVFSGDTLFNGDVGRPDLLASFGITKDELVKQLYVSVRRLMTLPDKTLLYPAHGAGSLCGKNLGAEQYSSIGEQRRVNYAVKASSQKEFEALVTEGQTAAPAYFTRDALINKRGVKRSVEDLASHAKPLSPARLREMLASPQEWQFVDVRDSDLVANDFIPGFVNIGLDGWYASWAGTLLDERRPIVLLVDPGRQHEAIMRLARVGMDHVHGWVEGGINAWKAFGGETSQWKRLTAKEASVMAGSGEAVIVDVRVPSERDQHGYIAKAEHLPLADFAGDKLSDLVRRVAPRPVIAMCAGGYRSAAAATALRRAGVSHVYDVVGGFTAWSEAGLPSRRD